MQIDDLRDYLDILEEYREVQRIDAEVDWNLEMGAITRRVYDLGAPAVLFENVKGYPKGFRALGAPLGTANVPAMACLRAPRSPCTCRRLHPPKISCRPI